mmetsp:Transcript_56489/g.132501  ORF Transcript_56489/g.132501 Transcript_56489/m.132501 type:complete len:265 (-) Transcript_56489:25-819(-)
MLKGSTEASASAIPSLLVKSRGSLPSRLFARGAVTGQDLLSRTTSVGVYPCRASQPAGASSNCIARASKRCSRLRSWSRKPMLGHTPGRASCTCFNASLKGKRASSIKCAITTVGLLDWPAEQCTSTALSLERLSAMKAEQASKCRSKRADGLSSTATTKRTNGSASVGSKRERCSGPKASRTSSKPIVRIWLMPRFCNASTSEAARNEPSHKLRTTSCISIRPACLCRRAVAGVSSALSGWSSSGSTLPWLLGEHSERSSCLS